MEVVCDGAASCFDILPDEVVLYLFFAFLPSHDRCRSAMVCRKWLSLARDERMWRRLCQKRFRFIRPEMYGIDSPLTASGSSLSSSSGGTLGSSSSGPSRRSLSLSRDCVTAVERREETRDEEDAGLDEVSGWERMYVDMERRETQTVDKMLMLDPALQSHIVELTSRLGLCVSDSDGNIQTVPTKGKVVRQPLFSPAGDRIVWIAIDRSGSFTESQVCVVDTNDLREENVRSVTVPCVPFFSYFSPCGTRLVLLCNAPIEIGQTVQMLLLDLWGKAKLQVVGYGRPYFVSWSNRKMSFITKRDVEVMDLVTVDANGVIADSTRLPIAGELGSFSTPVWYPHPSEDLFVYAMADSTCEEDEQRLVMARLSADKAKMETVRELARVKEGSVRSFAVSRDGERIAYMLSRSIVYMKDMALEQTEEGPKEKQSVCIPSKPGLIAYFFSPNGRYLLLLHADMANPGYPLRWWCWDCNKAELFCFPNGNFAPSETFLRSYLPFFDQYFQTFTLFNPTSTAFAYCGLSPLDSSNSMCVWLQPIDRAQEPRFAHKGISFVIWSPQ